MIRIAVGLAANGTTDDTAALQANIDAVVSGGGGILQLPSGSILVSQTVSFSHVPGGKIWVRGEGMDVTVIKSTVTANGIVIVANGSDNCHISDLTVDAQNKLGAGTTAVFAQSSKNISIKRIAVKNFTIFGIAVQGAVGFNISDNLVVRPTIARTQNQSIATFGGLENKQGIISDNRCYGSGWDISGNEIVMSGNYIDGFGFGGGITSELDAFTHNLTYAFNTCINGAGIDTNNTTAMGIENWGRDSLITGNHCANHTGDGINVGGKNCLVVGNHCNNNGGSGIHIRYGDINRNGSGSFINNNICIDNKGYGYAEQTSGLTNMHYGYNNLTGNQAGAARFAGHGWKMLANTY